MFKKFLNIIFFNGSSLFCLSQNGQRTDSISSRQIDSLKQQVSSTKSDSGRMMITERIGYFYEHLNIDSSLHFFNEALNIARQYSYAWAEARILAGISGVMEHQGRYAEAFELLFESLKIAEGSNSAYDIARANRRISGVYFELQNYSKAVAYLLKALRIDETSGYKDKVAIDHYALADAYEKINKLDSAALHVNMAFKQKDLLKNLMQYVYGIDGHIKKKKGNYEQAALSYRKGFEEAQLSSDLISSAQICAGFSVLYEQQNLKDSAIVYALRGFNYAKEVSYKKGIMLNGNLLAELYDSTKPLLALQYYKTAAAAKDSLYGVNSIQAVENLVAKEEAKQKELEDAQIAYRNKLKLYGLLTGLSVLLIIAFILYRNNRHKQKANITLQQQKQKVENTLSELKSTQVQLIQSEKMASLGELTAGIAHEIQNPLNFVNNFSEVNAELIEELKNELKSGNSDEAILIADDIRDNEQKINHHGKRADAIVKGMLQHSRISTGQKELTNINTLADEYLRLAYHGMRAKDNFFNVNIKTDFDESIEKIKIIPQDIGRVILNLITNAFYAVNEKKKQQPDSYEPTVTVSTKRLGTPLGDRGKIEIKVSDNGNGIPQKVLEKIFQPFFTTKPTGQGTGLGLSLSYDIIKAHGGELRVETKEGEGAKFTIQLP
jgi:two-component system, NtrC family, sensor kinase